MKQYWVVDRVNTCMHQEFLAPCISTSKVFVGAFVQCSAIIETTVGQRLIRVGILYH